MKKDKKIKRHRIPNTSVKRAKAKYLAMNSTDPAQEQEFLWNLVLTNKDLTTAKGSIS